MSGYLGSEFGGCGVIIRRDTRKVILWALKLP